MQEHAEGLGKAVQHLFQATALIGASSKGLQDMIRTVLEVAAIVNVDSVSQVTRTVASLVEQVRSQEASLQEQKARVEELNAAIEDKEALVSELESKVEEREGRVAELQRFLKERDAKVEELQVQLEEQEKELQRERDAAKLLRTPQMETPPTSGKAAAGMRDTGGSASSVILHRDPAPRQRLKKVVCWGPTGECFHSPSCHYRRRGWSAARNPPGGKRPCSFCGGSPQTVDVETTDMVITDETNPVAKRLSYHDV